MRINLGCGDDIREGWINVDLYSNTADVQAGILDFVKGLDDDSVDVVLCSHVLEHLPRNRLPMLFKEISRVIKPGGTFKIVSPTFNPTLLHENIFIHKDTFRCLYSNERYDNAGGQDDAFRSDFSLRRRSASFSFRYFLGQIKNLLWSLLHDEFELELERKKDRTVGGHNDEDNLLEP